MFREGEATSAGFSQHLKGGSGLLHGRLSHAGDRTAHCGDADVADGLDLGTVAAASAGCAVDSGAPANDGAHDHGVEHSKRARDDAAGGAVAARAHAPRRGRRR